MCILLELEGGACLSAGDFKRAESSLRELMALQAKLYGKGCAYLIAGALLISAIISDDESSAAVPEDKSALRVMNELLQTFCVSHVDGLSNLDLRSFIMSYCTSSKCMMHTSRLFEEAARSNRRKIA
jgi:hypothetical protein